MKRSAGALNEYGSSVFMSLARRIAFAVGATFAAFVILAFATGIVAAQECISPEDRIVQAGENLRNAGLNPELFLVGPDLTADLLAFYNEIPPATAYEADVALVALMPSLSLMGAEFFLHGCRINEGSLRIPLSFFYDRFSLAEPTSYIPGEDA